MQDTEPLAPGAISHADPDAVPTPRRPFVAADWQLFDYVESGTISPNAAYLYLLLLKRWPKNRTDKRVWPSRETLATEMNLSRPESVDPYLRQLRDAGLISWEKWYVGGMRARNRYTLYLIADLKERDQAGSAVPLKTAQRTPVQRASDTPWTEDELEQGELSQVDLDPKKDSQRTVPPPFASLSSAADAENSSTNSAERWAAVDAKEPFTDWRSNDREAFKLHAGERIKSDGNGGWRSGLFTAEAFYNAFRRREKKPIRWPGKFLEDLYAKGEDQMIEDWFMDQGLEIRA